MDGVYYDYDGNLLGIEEGEKTMEPWKERMIKEYKELKGRYERLHRILIKHDCGTLDFELQTPIDLLRRQESDMVDYLTVLELRAEFEKVDIYS